MANKTTNTPPATAPVSAGAPALVEIDVLREKHKVSRAIFAGVCAAQNWASGKAVAESDFLAAVEKFKRSPMDGKKEEKK